MNDNPKTIKKPFNLDLLSFVSHELKTPLSTLKLSVDMLKTKVPKEDKRIVKIMDEEITWMIQFISDTLDLKKAKHITDLDLSWHNWNKWIQAIKGNVETKLNIYGKKLKIHFSKQEREVYMDSLYMKQVLSNLIMNAVEYSPEKSTIEISWEIKDNVFNVHVMNPGVSIDPKDKNKIFEPFYRGRENRYCKIKGSGLGLAIVKAIVQAHGGNVHTSNCPNNTGSVFTFTLPQTRASLIG